MSTGGEEDKKKRGQEGRSRGEEQRREGEVERRRAGLFIGQFE